MRQDSGGVTCSANGGDRRMVLVAGSLREEGSASSIELTHYKHHHITNAKHKKCLDISIAAVSRCFSSLATAQLPGE
jgi:hypothetical protein